jgi:hypothetical protein
LYTLVAVTVRTRRLLAVAALVAALVAVVAYATRRSACETDRTAMKGEVRRDASGRLTYFDGRCWTVQPQTPRDTPF